ncbi:MAG TPA: hypothetical protein VF148_08145 [Acidimicrobiia bacterium]
MTSDTISIIQGRRQGPALRMITIVAWVLAGIGAITDHGLLRLAGILAVYLVTATPLLRVGWLVFRWIQERDWRFVWTALALMAVIAIAGVVSLVGQ